MASFYRPEALEGQRRQWVGEVRAAWPPPLGLVVGFVVLCIELIVLGLRTTELTRYARVKGSLFVQGAPLLLRAPSGGVVLERFVSPGQRVRAGDLLFRLALSGSGRVDGLDLAGMQDPRASGPGAGDEIASVASRRARDLRDAETLFELRAPVDGFVFEEDRAKGQAFGGRSVVASVLPLSTQVRAEFVVPAGVAETLRAGQSLTAHLSASTLRTSTRVRVELVEAKPKPGLAASREAAGGWHSSGEDLYSVVAQWSASNEGVTQAPWLEPGALVEGEFPVGRRRLIDLVLAPVHEMPSRL